MVILVAYASRHNSTHEIASRIASRLSSHNTGPSDPIETQCASIETIHDLESFEAVIIGSAVHFGAWLPEASKFLDQHSNALKQRPVWAFSVGMTQGLPKWIRAKATEDEEKKIAAAINQKGIKVGGHKLFAGVRDHDKSPFFERMLWTCVGGLFGDLRDWHAVEQWTDKIATEICEKRSSVS